MTALVLERRKRGDPVADLMGVLEVSRELSATTKLMPLLHRVESAALKILRCERATVFLHDASRGELCSKVATGVDQICFPVDQGIAGEAVRTRQVINVADAYGDPRFNPEIDRRTGFHTENVLAVPLLGLDGAVVGVLQVLNQREGAFGPWETELLGAFAAQVGVALQRQLLLEHYREKQRIEQDLHIAQEIQQRLLPSRAPRIEGFDVAGWNRPAEETGGDCFDFIPLPDGSVVITTTDVAGHGIGPALMMAECRALIRALLRASPVGSGELQATIERINDLLCEDLPDNRFITAFVGLLTPARRELSFLSAGHGPLIQYRRREDRIVALDPDSRPLGLWPGLDLPAPRCFAMEPGDMMIVVTDGLFEWASADGELFGLERLYAAILGGRDLGADALIQHLCGEAERFAGGAPQKDDLTAVVIRRC